MVGKHNLGERRVNKSAHERQFTVFISWCISVSYDETHLKVVLAANKDDVVKGAKYGEYIRQGKFCYFADVHIQSYNIVHIKESGLC